MISDLSPLLKDFAFIPDRALDSFRELTNLQGSSFELRRIIEKEYSLVVSIENNPNIVLKQGNTIVAKIEQADRVYLVTSIDSLPVGSKVVLSFVHNKNPDKQPWEMQKAIADVDYNNENFVDLGDKPKEMLKNFAFWPSFLDDLKELKNELALPENWSFVENPSEDDFPILKSFITYTFAKLWRDKQVSIGIGGRYSVFNTGLVNKNYQYIYALFETNIGPRPWKFSMFCVPGNRQGGRALAENFKILPKPAHYFNDISDISYIIAFEKSPDEQFPDLQPDHYFIDHPDRLPLHFLLDGCRKSPTIIAELKRDLCKFSKEKKECFWKNVGVMIGENSEVYDDLESAFRNAVRKAVIRASWNYRTAIPVYFPSNNKMSILLPLSFGGAINAEVALVLERNSVSQRYTAPTILRLPMAYSNARLVCKPESDWLTQRVFETTVSDEQQNNEEDI